MFELVTDPLFFIKFVRDNLTGFVQLINLLLSVVLGEVLFHAA